jgi:excinuclease ABC subunit C
MFLNGEPDRARYRRFRIASAQQPDDYGMMREVLTRYLVRAHSEHALPELILVDGGKGQLNVLVGVLREMDIHTVAAAALAKGRARQQPGQSRDETVFIPRRKNPVLFPKQSKALLLLQHIRNEAHRFAVAYHTAVKKATAFSSLLEEVPGIGKKTAAKLLRYFGSIENVLQATPAELGRVPELSGKTAAMIHAALQQLPKTPPSVNV